MTDDGPHKARAQLAKALRIEHALRLAGCDDERTARALTDEGRRAAERAAGVRLSSETTWELTYLLLSAPRPHADQIARESAALAVLDGRYDDGNGVLIGGQS